MRLQLFLGFALTILVGMVTSWILATRTTDAEFAVLVSDTNYQRAEVTAPSLLAEYEKQGNWEGVQTSLTEQLAQQAAITEKLPDFSIEISEVDGVSTFTVGNVSFSDTGISHYEDDTWEDGFSLDFDFLEAIFDPALIEQWFEPSTPALQDNTAFNSFYLIQPDEGRFERQAPFAVDPIVIQPADIGFAVTSIVAADQRGIVVNGEEVVVVDTTSELLGKEIDEAFLDKGVPLYRNGTKIGTFIITSQDGVYTVEQNAFIEEVKEGYLLAGGISTGLALILALILSHQMSKPMRSLTAATTRIQGGEWGYEVTVNRMNGDIGKLARAFNEMSRHLAEQRRLRAQLVDDLAHELKTPLTLMRLELEGMADRLQSPAEAADHLNQELEEVSELVSDLIFLASRDTAPTPQMDWVDVNMIVASAVRRFEGSASDGRMLRYTLADNLPPIYGDAYLVQRAVSNLIANAIRYTPRGGEITLLTTQEKDSIQVIVRDTGEGIASEHLPHIFERFYRVDSSRSRHSGGRGLGLAIVKQIMQQHQGQVLVESQVGHGSTFKLVWSV